jgi:hypothetical protein
MADDYNRSQSTPLSARLLPLAARMYPLDAQLLPLADFLTMTLSTYGMIESMNKDILSMNSTSY